MGKVPPGFRRAVAGSSQSALFKASNSSASVLQEQIPPPVTPLQSHKKSSKKEPTKVIAPAKKSNTPPIIFESSNLSDALGALALLEEMEAKGCVPNSCTYNTLLHGLCKARLLDKGVELYGVMKKGDLKLETGCYGTFLRALCRNGRVAEAYEVFYYDVESKSLKDVTAFSTLETSLKWLRKAREQGLAV